MTKPYSQRFVQSTIALSLQGKVVRKSQLRLSFEYSLKVWRFSSNSQVRMKSLVLTPVTFFKISWENALEVRPLPKGKGCWKKDYF